MFGGRSWCDFCFGMRTRKRAGRDTERAGGVRRRRGTLRVSNIDIFTCLITFFSRNSFHSDSAPEKRACKNINVRNSKQPAPMPFEHPRLSQCPSPPSFSDIRKI